MFSQKLKQTIGVINFNRLNPLKWKWRDHEEVVKNLLITLIYMLILLVGYVLVQNYWVPSADQQFVQMLKDEGRQSGNHNCIVVGKVSICW